MNIWESSGSVETAIDPSAIELPPTQPIDITQLLKSQPVAEAEREGRG
jgi:hypothetical protein